MGSARDECALEEKAEGKQDVYAPFPFWGDTSFCVGIGVGLLVVHSRAQKEQDECSDSEVQPSGDLVQ